MFRINGGLYHRRRYVACINCRVLYEADRCLGVIIDLVVDQFRGRILFRG